MTIVLSVIFLYKRQSCFKILVTWTCYRHLTNVQAASMLLTIMIEEWNYLFCYGRVSSHTLADAQARLTNSPKTPNGTVRVVPNTSIVTISILNNPSLKFLYIYF